MSLFLSRIALSVLACFSISAAWAFEDDIFAGGNDVIMPVADFKNSLPKDPFDTRWIFADRSWMHSDVSQAWWSGYRGQGVSVTVVDDVNAQSSLKFAAPNFIPSAGAQPHGYWTTSQVALVAPMADVYTQQVGSGFIALKSGFNVFNLSYGIYSSSSNGALGLQNSILSMFASAGSAVVVKAAGNDSTAVYREIIYPGTPVPVTVDVLNLALKNTPGAIIVGALSSNGSVSKPATMASYSNYAGDAKNFLVVGVDPSLGLAGTSFAAPIISGYAAIIASKFKDASPTTVTNKLLDTARQDTVQYYSSYIYGRGEASLSRALAPVTIR